MDFEKTKRTKKPLSAPVEIDWTEIYQANDDDDDDDYKMKSIVMRIAK